MKKWKCIVCGYIHEGDEPPEKCPVCGADRSKFELLEPEETDQSQTDTIETETEATGKAPEATGSTWKNKPVFELMIKQHVHPISVHIPNGVLPVSVVFIVLSAIFNFSGLSQAAFYNLVVVVLTIPFVLFSGFLEWQLKYGGSFTSLFIIKMISAGIVALTSISLVVWLHLDPQVAMSPSSGRLSFFIVNFVMLAAAGTAGFIGGKLLYKE